MSQIPSPLLPHPPRQAKPAVRGWAYQIWHSLLAWLTLREPQTLVLEGAEDFDVLEGDGATTVQVKNTKRRLTLGSNIVADALSNYLETAERNPTRKIKYRLLTTSVIGAERGSPFGRGVRGLELWSQIQRSRDYGAAHQVGTFLRRRKIPPVLHNFLREATPERLFTELIEPINWDTGSLDLNYVEQAVFDHLILLGDSRDIPPIESKKSIGTLLRATLNSCITPNPRPLTRSHLLELFEEATTQRISHSELYALRRVAQSLSLSVISAEPLASHEFTPTTFGRIAYDLPPLGFAPLRRQALLEECARALKRHPALALFGTAGTGKTLLARAIAEDSSRPICWVSLVDCDPRQIPDLLARLRQQSLRSDQGILVLDDLHLGENRQLWEQIAGLLFEFSRRMITTLITSYRTFPPKIRRQLGDSATHSINLPMFSQEEVALFLATLGCPPHECQAWTPILYSKTSGHPQLVHALANALSQRNWPPPEPNDLFSEPGDLEKERSEARLILATTAPEPERNFLYALSLYGSVFRRDQAVAVGGLTAISLSNPGDTLDKLTGPWIEPIGNGYLRLSPLLQHAGQRAWDARKSSLVRAQIADTIAQVGNLTLLEVNSLLLLALLEDSDKLIKKLCTTLLTAPPEVWKSIADAVAWVVAVDLEPSGRKRDWQPHTLLLFRVLQFRIAATCRPDFCRRILARWQADADQVLDKELSALYRLTISGEALSQYEAPLPPSTVLSHLVALGGIRQEGSPRARQIVEDLEHALRTRRAKPQRALLSSGFLLVAHRCKNANDIIDLLDALASLSPTLRKTILAEYVANPRVSALFVSQAWHAEAEKDTPEWDLPKRALLRSVRNGRRWKVPPLAIAGYTGLATIQSEYLKDTAGALAILNHGEKALGPVPPLRHQRASVYFAASQFHEALDIWNETIPHWRSKPPNEVDDGVAATLACRMAGIAASQLGSWLSSAEYFTEGAERARLCMSSHFEAGFKRGCSLRIVARGESSRLSRCSYSRSGALGSDTLRR